MERRAPRPSISAPGLCQPGGDARRSISNIRNFCRAADSIKEALVIEPTRAFEGVRYFMSSFYSRVSAVFLMITLVGVVACNASDHAGAAVPNPAADATLATAKSEQTVVLAGGCFWGIQAVFQHVKGVIGATSGYSGGAAGTAKYELVSNGDTGHAESEEHT